MKLKSSIILTVCLLLSFMANAQVVTNEIPPSFTEAYPINFDPILVPKPDLNQIRQQDAVEDQIKDIPWRFGVEQTVNYNFQNSGLTLHNDDGSETWFLKIASKGAKSINLNFNKFKLSNNAKLFIYNEAKTDVLGAITAANNNESGEFAIRPIKGESITLELIIPANEKDQIDLNISGVVYGYKSIHDKAAKAFGTSGSCNINVNCTAGNNWQDVKRSIVMILRSNNTRWCSGALINNVRQDSTPYILTANHCGLQTNSIFIFNYESPNCAPNSDGSLSKSMSGANSRATNANSDFHLFELLNTPPASYEVYYAGWDKSNTPSSVSTGIHHPDGDVMKISVDNDPPLTSGYYTTNGSTHWTVQDWDLGTTEGGSSGSPLFNEFQQIIGQLHGGNAACGNNAEDYYGKFSVSWNAISGNSNQLKPWLDPDNTGTTQVPGLDSKASLFNTDISINAITDQEEYLCQDSSITPSIIVKNLGNNSVSSFTVNYSSNGFTLGSFNWTGNLTRNQITKITLPAIVLGNGLNSINYSIVNPNGISDQNIANNSVIKSTRVNINPLFVNLQLKTDDYGNEITWNFEQLNSGTVLDFGGPYAQVSGGTIHNYNVCLYDSCFNFNLFDSQNDGFTGFWGNGYALITDQNGDTLVFENNFTTGFKANSFCVQKLGTNINEIDSRFELSVYPNPIKSGNILNVETNLKVRVELFDLTGKLIFEGNNRLLIPNGQATGIYLIKVIDSSSGNIISTDKLVIQK